MKKALFRYDNLRNVWTERTSGVAIVGWDPNDTIEAMKSVSVARKALAQHYKHFDPAVTEDDFAIEFAPIQEQSPGFRPVPSRAVT